MVYKQWYKLDNVGKFYASTKSNKFPKVFRYSAILTEEVDEVILQEALNKTMEVYANFNVNLKKGLFWYYLEAVNKTSIVTKENLPVCFKLYNDSDDFLYRISFYKRKINLEVSHILSDGRGSVELFKLLLTNYINIKYNLKLDTSKNNVSILEKTEDSFDKYYQKTIKSKKEKQKIYVYKNRKYNNQTKFMECHMNVKEVLTLAHNYNTTLTGLLVSVLIFSFKEELKLSDMDKYIKIDIPVDLRSYFKSASSLNFFGLTKISYKFNTKKDQLENVVKEVNKQLKENLEKERVIERVNKMVSFEKNWFCKISPIFLKDWVLKFVDKFTSQKSTTCFSNIGVIKLENEIEEMVESISVLTSTESFQFTSCTLKNDLCIGISSRYINNDVIKNFCRYFSLKGIDVRIDVSEVE